MKDLKILKALWDEAKARKDSDYCAFNMKCQAIAVNFSKPQIIASRNSVEAKLKKRQELSDAKIKEIIGSRGITERYAMTTKSYLDFVLELNKHADKAKLESQLAVINYILA